MRRSGVVKFPHSVQLFKFCQQVLCEHRGKKVHDQDIGAILNFNPSDCSHWKRGEKNIKSVFALEKLAAHLDVESALIHDLASGVIALEEALFEYHESQTLQTLQASMGDLDATALAARYTAVEAFVADLHTRAAFTTPPLYLPEVMRFFPFVTTQPTDMMDKLSRILRTKPGQYMIQFRKGELRPQTRMSIAKDLARVIFEGERERFPMLGTANAEMVAYEELYFTANLLAPKALLSTELGRLDARRNIVAELSATLWIPKVLVSFQLQEILRAKAISPVPFALSRPDALSMSARAAT